MRSSAWARSAGEIEVEMLSEALQVAPVEELDLDVQVLIAQIKVGGEGLEHPARLVLFEHERPRFVFPGDAVVIQHLRALELRGAGEPRRLGSAVRLEHRELELHPAAR